MDCWEIFSMHWEWARKRFRDFSRELPSFDKWEAQKEEMNHPNLWNRLVGLEPMSSVSQGVVCLLHQLLYCLLNIWLGSWMDGWMDIIDVWHVSIAALSQHHPLFSHLLSFFSLLPGTPHSFGGRELAFQEAEGPHQWTIFRQSLLRTPFTGQLAFRGGVGEGRGHTLLLSFSNLRKERSSPCLWQVLSK